MVRTVTFAGVTGWDGIGAGDEAGITVASGATGVDGGMGRSGTQLARGKARIAGIKNRMASAGMERAIWQGYGRMPIPSKVWNFGSMDSRSATITSIPANPDFSNIADKSLSENPSQRSA